MESATILMPLSLKTLNSGIILKFFTHVKYRSGDPFFSFPHKIRDKMLQLTNKVSAPPTILRPRPVLPFSIRMDVSCPGTMGHVRGSCDPSSDIWLAEESIASVEDSPAERWNNKSSSYHITNHTIWAATWHFQQCGMCHQQRLRPACAYDQSDQSLS